MAGYYEGFDITLRSEDDNSAETNRYRAVEPGAEAGEGDVQDTAAAYCIGILQNRPNTDENMTVRVLGISKFVADEAIAVGDVLTSSADGQLIGTAPGTLADDFWVLGHALQTPQYLVPTAAGVIGLMVIAPYYNGLA